MKSDVSKKKTSKTAAKKPAAKKKQVAPTASVRNKTTA